MKKFISLITCLIILVGVLVLPEPIEVHAEESATKEYYIEFLASSDFARDNNTYQGYAGHMEFNLASNVDIAMYYELDSYNCISVLTIFRNSDGTYTEVNQFVGNISRNENVSGRKNYWYKKGSYKFYGGRSYEFYDITKEIDDSVNGQLYWKTPTIEESGYIATNVPIFTDKTTAVNYLNGSVSIKDAVNYETDLTDIKYDLEIPKNLKIKDVQNNGSSGHFLFTWEQTDQNYKNWKTEIYEYTDFRYRSSVLIFSWEDWKYVKDYYVGQTIIDTYKLSYKIGHMKYADDDNLRDKISKEYPNDYGGVYEFGNHKVYMRNYYYDGTYRHYSNWVIIEFNPEDGVGSWINPDMDTTVVEKEGSELVVDENGIPEQPDSNVVTDSDYTGVVNDNYDRVQGTDLLSWISNGFNIGGDNGVISMLSETFSFIPEEIWGVFAAGISMMVVVAIFKFVRG